MEHSLYPWNAETLKRFLRPSTLTLLLQGLLEHCESRYTLRWHRRPPREGPQQGLRFNVTQTYIRQDSNLHSMMFEPGSMKQRPKPHRLPLWQIVFEFLDIEVGRWCTKPLYSLKTNQGESTRLGLLTFTHSALLKRARANIYLKKRGKDAVVSKIFSKFATILCLYY